MRLKKPQKNFTKGLPGFLLVMYSRQSVCFPLRTMPVWFSLFKSCEWETFPLTRKYILLLENSCNIICFKYRLQPWWTFQQYEKRWKCSKDHYENATEVVRFYGSRAQGYKYFTDKKLNTWPLTRVKDRCKHKQSRIQNLIHISGNFTVCQSLLSLRR